MAGFGECFNKNGGESVKSNKKYLRDTVNVTLASVGVNEANKLSYFGKVAGAGMVAGVLKDQLPRKKRGRK